VASFFYSYREGELQTDHSNMLRSILYDILTQNETFFFHFQTYYRQALQPGTRLQWPYKSLKSILKSIGEHPTEERLYLIIDAMDESDDTDRRNIIQLLRQICLGKTSCKMKIFLTSRPVAGLSHRSTETKLIRLQDENEQDILNFARSFLGPELELPSDILHQATDYIVTHAQGVFIWVHLVKQVLLSYSECGATKKEIFDYLKSIPTELKDFYKRIVKELERREQRDIEDGKKMFRLVLFAYRPLSLEEFRHALAIPDDLHAEFLPCDRSFEAELILGISKRIIHCGGNFLEVKGVPGALLPSNALLELLG